MASKDELKRWWDGLSAQERADALSAQDAGRLSQGLEKSLKKAGLVDRGKKGGTIPGDVNEFLKMRH